MDDLDALSRDFGFVARGKSNPMKSGAQSDRQSIDEPLFDDIFGGPSMYTSSSNTNNNKQSSMSEFDYDSIFKSSEPKNNTNSSSNSKSNNMAFSLPVYDKPVYDEDIFDGLPGLKNKTGRSTMRFDDNVFASVSSPPRSNSVNRKSDSDELLGNLGRNEKVGENYRSSSVKSNSNAKGFDDLLAGYATVSSAASNRPMPVSSRGSVPIASSKSGNGLDNPFVVLESSRTPGSSSPGVFMDSLDDINKLRESRSVKAEASSGSDGAFDDLDPLNRFGKSALSFSLGRDGRGKNGSPSRALSAQSDTTREQKGSSSFIYSENNTEKKIPVDDFHEPPFFDMPNVSTDFHESFSQPISPQYYETGSNIDVSPSSEEQGEQSDDVWLTVSEIPLFTQPIAAPPPSRAPPPLPRRQKSKLETSTFSSGSRKKDGEFLSPTIHNQHLQNPKVAPAPAKSPPVSPFDEIDDFSIGKSWNSVDGSANFQYSEETNAFSAAAASAAAMKDVMNKAEAKFRHAKEVREREYAKTARNKESVQLENDEHDGENSEFGENQKRLERESKQKEEEEREQVRLKRDQQRSRDLERERGRLAVERANREARERAAAEARERAAAETRLKAERAAVAKANAEARGRAEKVAVQRVQAEARERAAAEAKERAEKAAAEARERASTEAMERAAAAREKDLRDKAAVAKAEAEARRRAERAAVDRAAAEARERASVEARERAAAAAAAKINQQNNDNDLESFFSMGRASSAPRTRTNSAFSSFDEQFQKFQKDQNKGGYDSPRWTSASTEPSSSMKKASSTTNIVDDLSSIFGGGPSSGEFQDVVGETEERRRARLDRHQRTQERAAKALAEKNQRDLQVQRDQEERNRISETLDFEIRRWAAGKEGNLRALLSTLQYVLWPECGWQPVSLTDLITGASVKKVYRKATLCIHPDKVQQKGASLQQKFIAEKVFDMLKEAWTKFNSEELF